VKCGLYLGGRRYISIVEGPLGGGKRTEQPLTLDPTGLFELKVTTDLAAGKVVLTVNGKSITAALGRPLRAITHYGYCAMNTVTAFGPIEIADSEQPAVPPATLPLLP